MDYNYHNNNVYMHTCHGENNQMWYMESEQLKTNYDDKCLDYNYNNGNVYMHNCHAGSTQQWYLDGESLRSRYDTAMCLDYHPENGNIYMVTCQSEVTVADGYTDLGVGKCLAGGADPSYEYIGGGGSDCQTKCDESSTCYGYTTSSYNNCLLWTQAPLTGGGEAWGGGHCSIKASVATIEASQQFYWALPPNAALASRVKARHGESCLDYNYDSNNMYMHTCHDGKNQKFYLDGTDLKSLYGNKCADHNANNDNVYMQACHAGTNQQFYFNAETLRANDNPNNCLAVHENGNIYMHACHGGANQNFFLETVVNGLEHDEVDDEIIQEDEEERVCKDWCWKSTKHQNKSWVGEKCAWKSCASCSQCS
jgi:hypothetical protein